MDNLAKFGKGGGRILKVFLCMDQLGAGHPKYMPDIGIQGVAKLASHPISLIYQQELSFHRKISLLYESPRGHKRIILLIGCMKTYQSWPMVLSIEPNPR